MVAEKHADATATGKAVIFKIAGATRTTVSLGSNPRFCVGGQTRKPEARQISKIASQARRPNGKLENHHENNLKRIVVCNAFLWGAKWGKKKPKKGGYQEWKFGKRKQVTAWESPTGRVYTVTLNGGGVGEPSGNLPV